METSRILQRVVFPCVATADRTSLYAHWPEGEVTLSQADGRWLIPPETRVDLCTFFNCFSRHKWCVLAKLEDLRLYVTGQGRIRLRVNALTPSGAAISVVDEELQLCGGTTFEIDDPMDVPGEILAVELQTLDEACTLDEIHWATRQPPLRAVRLAAVITTFRREEQARRAITKFDSQIAPGAAPGDVHLFIVDNGASLDEQGSANVTFVRNARNLGGAGGFSRGFLEARDTGRFTHVLFMDDDASCEPESVWRSMSLAAYLVDEDAAIAGAMLFADRPHIQYEKGAYLHIWGESDRPFSPHNHLLDLSNPDSVLCNDPMDHANYGAFWFFAFPIKAVKYLPFPFFVRGDDIDFSLCNSFKIVTLNGIACWCDNFAYKLTPPTEYLATRSCLALMLMHGTKAAGRRSLRHFINCAFDLGQRFDYGGMKATLDAIQDALRGPAFFAQNPAPLKKLEDLKKAHTAVSPLLADFLDLKDIDWAKQRVRRLAGRLTFAGFLLPRRAVGNNTVHRRVAWEVGRWNLLTYRGGMYGRSRDIRLFHREQRKWQIGLLRLVWVRQRALWRLNRLQKRYKTEAAHFRSETYWRKILELPAAARDA